MATPAVTPEEFIEAWQTSESISEVADKLKMKYTAVNSRARHYRKAGVELKRMASGRGSLDADRLNELAQSFLNGKPK